MDFRKLHYFVAVAEQQHVGRAAEQLNIAQPALSLHIQRLEAQIGVALFTREKRRLALTSAGTLFLHQARLALQQADYAMEVVKRAERGELGQVRVDLCGSAMLGATMRRMIGDFKRSHPDVDLVLREHSLVDQLAKLAAKDCDVGVVRGPLPFLPPGLASQLIEREGLVVALPASHRLACRRTIAMHDLRDEMFVMPIDPPGVGLAGQIALLAQAAGFMPRIHQQAEQASAIACLVASGFGVSILPASLGQLYLEDLVFRSLEEPAVTSLHLLYRPDDTCPVIRAFLGSCRHSLGLTTREASSLRNAA